LISLNVQVVVLREPPIKTIDNGRHYHSLRRSSSAEVDILRVLPVEELPGVRDLLIMLQAIS